MLRVVLIAAALATAFYARLFFGYTWYDQWDLVVQELPRFDFLARTFQTTGRLPLWDPHLWAGQPVMGMPQPGPLYPLSLLLYLWPVDETGHVPPAALHVYYLLIHVQALLLLYGLCRELEAPPVGAWIGACLFTFGGVMGSSPWPDHLNGVVWAPGLAWMAVRIYRDRRPWLSATLAGLMLGLAWLSGHPEAPFWLTLTLTAALLPRWRQLALVLPVAAILAAPQVIPSVEFGQRSRRFVETGRPVAWNERIPYSVHAKYSLSWKGILGVVIPGQDEQAGNMALTGVVGVVLALLGGGGARFFTSIAAFGVIMALGFNTPIHGWVYQWVPMADKIRVPVRALFLTNLGLAGMAALGSRRLDHRIQFVALVLVLGETWMASRDRITPPEAVTMADWRAKNADLLGFMRALPEPRRLMIDPEVLPFNVGDSDGIDQLYGILPVVSANMEQHELHTARVQDLLAVTHSVGRTGTGEEIFRSRAGVRVYRRLDPLPRAWFAKASLRVRTTDDLRRNLQLPGFDLRTVMSTGQPPPVEQCAARVTEYRRPVADLIVVMVESPCRGWLIVSESADPGWWASVDGARLQIELADEALLGVAVPTGAKRIEFHYGRATPWADREGKMERAAARQSASGSNP